MDMNKEKYVFISYSSEHLEEAEAVRTLLMKHGISCWMDKYDMPAGSKYAGVLYEAIEKCTCFLLMLTEAAQNKSEHVYLEVEAAVSNKKPMITLKMEEFELNSDFKYFVQGRHFVTIDAIEEKTPAMNKVIDSLRKIVNEDASEEGIEFDIANHLSQLYEEWKIDDAIDTCFGETEWGELENETEQEKPTGIVRKCLTGLYLIFFGVFSFWMRKPLWEFATVFEDLGGSTSDVAFTLALRTFVVVHILLWMIGIVLLILMNRKTRKIIKTILMLGFMIVITWFNISNADIEGSRSKCTTSVLVYYCNEETHYEVLNGTIDFITKCEAKTISRENIETFIDGEFYYNEYLVLTKNSKEEWKRVTQAMELPKGTYAIYLPREELRNGGIWIEA